MTKTRILLRLLIGCCLISVLSGCWDYRRLDQTATVMGIGIDPFGKNKYQVTFQIPSMPGVLSGGSSSSQGGAPPATTINITTKGQSLGNTITYAQEHLDRSFFFGNLQSIVLNEKLSTTQMQEVLTEMLRNSRIPNTASLITTTNTAKDILTSKEITDEPVAIFLRNSVRNVKSKGFETPIPLWVFFRNTYGMGITPVTPRVFTDDTGKIIFDGLSIFNKFQLKGDLSRSQARGYNWVLNRVGKMQLAMKDDEGRPIVVKITRDKAHMAWKKMNGQYELYANIKAEGIVVQEPSRGTEEVTQSVINKMQKDAEKEIEQEVNASYKKFKNWGTDPYGYGRMVMIQNIHLFKKDQLSTRWIDEFKNSQLHVNVKMKLKGKGELL